MPLDPAVRVSLTPVVIGRQQPDAAPHSEPLPVSRLPRRAGSYSLTQGGQGAKLGLASQEQHLLDVFEASVLASDVDHHVAVWAYRSQVVHRIHLILTGDV